jgi:hypothetical protein
VDFAGCWISLPVDSGPRDAAVRRRRALKIWKFWFFEHWKPPMAWYCCILWNIIVNQAQTANSRLKLESLSRNDAIDSVESYIERTLRIGYSNKWNEENPHFTAGKSRSPLHGGSAPPFILRVTEYP